MLAISEPVVDPRLESFWVEPWPDDVTAALGHDPRSAYVERFWLSTLGPSAAWLLRTMAYGFDTSPDGFELAASDTARLLGLGDRTGRHSPFVRAVGRLCQFELAHMRATTVVVRRFVPWLDRRQVQRLPSSVQQEHTAWETAEAEADGAAAQRRRAATVAMSVIRSGGTIDDTERTLRRASVHPSLCHSLAEWAATQHALGQRPPQAAFLKSVV